MYAIPHSSYPSNSFTQIDRAQYGNAMFVPVQKGTNALRPENMKSSEFTPALSNGQFILMNK